MDSRIAYDYFVTVMRSKDENDWRSQAGLISQKMPRDYSFRGYYTPDESSFWKFLAAATTNQIMCEKNVEFAARLQVMLDLPCVPKNYVGQWAKLQLNATMFPGILFYDIPSIHWTPQAFEIVSGECVAIVWQRAHVS